MSGAFTIEPVTPALGARVHDIDVGKLDDAGFERLYAAWLEYKLLFIDPQSIDLATLEAFSRRFGELMQLPYIRPHPQYPYIIRVLKQADEVDMGVFGGEWHSDFSFLPAPPRASILLAEQVPACGGDTLWVDMVTALARMPAELRTELDGRDAIHCGTPYGVKHAPAPDTRFTGSIEIERNNPEADAETRHPAISRHPETGATMLFVNPTYTTRIEGLAAAVSEALLDAVYRHCTRPEFGCRFKWQPGALVIWDNRNTMHYAVNDYDGHRRCLYRTTIAGGAPLPA